MIFCKNCGTQIDDGLKFCPACGQAVEDAGDVFDGSFDNSQTYNAQPDQQFAQQPPMQTYDPNQQAYGGQPNYGVPPMGGGNFGIVERNLVTCILLSIVTCGIYGLYWFYTLTEDTNKISNEPNPTSGGTAILLTIVTCGIYGWYWMYKRGEYIDKYHAMKGQQTNNAVLYLILAIFELGIVSYALMQNELNQIARGY